MRNTDSGRTSAKLPANVVQMHDPDHSSIYAPRDKVHVANLKMTPTASSNDLKLSRSATYNSGGQHSVIGIIAMTRRRRLQPPGRAQQAHNMSKHLGSVILGGGKNAYGSEGGLTKLTTCPKNRGGSSLLKKVPAAASKGPPSV